MPYINNGGTLNVRLPAWAVHCRWCLRLCNSSAKITFDLANLGNPTTPLINAANLTLKRECHRQCEQRARQRDEHLVQLFRNAQWSGKLCGRNCSRRRDAH